MMTVSLLQWIGRYQIGAVLALSLGGLYFSPEMAMATLVSGILMTLNFQGMRFLLAGISQGDGNSTFYAILLGFKLLVMLGMVAILIAVLELNLNGLLVGLSSFFPGVALGIVHMQLTAGSHELVEEES